LIVLAARPPSPFARQSSIATTRGPGESAEPVIDRL
jgi:hypothetical protein